MHFKIQDETKKTFPIVYSEFIEDTGLSIISIQTPEGIFTGTARVHPDDKEKGAYTSFTGQTIAHMRAFIEYFKYRKRLDQYAKKTLEHIYYISPKNTRTSNEIYDKICELAFNIESLNRAIDKFNKNIKIKIENTDTYFKAKDKYR